MDRGGLPLARTKALLSPPSRGPKAKLSKPAPAACGLPCRAPGRGLAQQVNVRPPTPCTCTSAAQPDYWWLHLKRVLHTSGSALPLAQPDTQPGPGASSYVQRHQHDACWQRGVAGLVELRSAPRPGTERQTLPTPGNSSQWADQIASHRHKRWETLSPGGLTALPSSRGLLVQARHGRPRGALSRLIMQA